jgi:hypothetical protein
MKERIFLLYLLILLILPIYQVSANENESYFTEKTAKITQDKFHRERLFNASKLYTDGELVAGYDSDTGSISILSKQNKTLSLISEYNLFELGLNPDKTHIRTIEVLNNSIYMVVNEYGIDNDDVNINIRKIHFDNNKVIISEPLYTLPESFPTSINNDLILSKSANGDALIAVMYGYILETELVVIEVDEQTKELIEQGILSLESSTVHASINASGTLIVIPYNGEIKTYTQNETGEFSIAHSFMDEDLPRREHSERIMLNSESGHIALVDSTRFAILKITETAKVELILSVSSEELFESISLSHVALQLGSFVVTGNMGGALGEARVFTYAEDGSYNFQSTFDFSTLGDSFTNPALSYLYDNEMLIREHTQEKSAYGVLSFDDDVSFTYNRFVEREFANTELPWSIHHQKLVADNRLLIITGSDARLLDISSTKGFKTLKEIGTSLSWSNRHIKEVEENTFLLIGKYKYQVLYYDKVNESFSISTAQSYVDTAGDVIVLQGDYSKKIYGDWHNSKFIALTYNSQLGIFSYKNNDLIFESYLQENQEENFQIPGTKGIVSFGNAVHLVNPETRYLYSLRLLDDDWTVVSQYYVEGSSSMADEAFVVGEYLLLGTYWGDHIHTFKLEEDELKYISMNPGIKGLQDVTILDDMHFITYDNEAKEAKLLKLDDFGKVTQLYSLPSSELAKEKGGVYSLGLSSYQYSFYSDGQNLWYLLDRHMLGRLQLNRAPIWLNSNNTSISLNQGVERKFPLSDFIIDFDANSELSYSEQSLPSAFSITSQNELYFNGTEPNNSPLTITASDSELNAIFTFTLNFNYAPQLAPNYSLETVKQNQSLSINIAELFSDQEEHSFTLTMAEKSSFNLSANGILTGSLASVGEHNIEITAIDEYGANSTSVLIITVERKAIAIDEKSSSGGNMDYVLIALLTLILRLRTRGRRNQMLH